MIWFDLAWLWLGFGLDLVGCYLAWPWLGFGLFFLGFGMDLGWIWLDVALELVFTVIFAHASLS